MHILILNWRDIKNPTGGGAELLTHEIAKRWVKVGHKVTQISSRYDGGKTSETLDGVKIIRLGKWWTVHLHAMTYYFKHLRDKTDVIIDEVHWFPFFACLYAKDKTVLLVCEIADKLFYQIFPWPAAILGRSVEKFYLWLHKNTPTLAISPSTKKDLVKEGFNKDKITVLPMGVSLPDDLDYYCSLPKENKPTLIYVGRINKQKGTEDALEAFKIVKDKIPGAVLWIVGTGKEQYMRNYKLQDSVRLFGFVSEAKKFELLSRANILIAPSVHEGWGLIIPEANAVGTPAIVYNVAGLRDVVKNNVNGIIVESNSQAMAQAATELLMDKPKLIKLSESAKQEAKKYNWDNTAKTALQVLQDIINKS